MLQVRKVYRFNLEMVLCLVMKPLKKLQLKQNARNSVMTSLLVVGGLQQVHMMMMHQKLHLFVLTNDG